MRGIILISWESHRGQQRACETKFVAVRVNQVEETLSPFRRVAGRGSWLAPRRECTFVKSINVGDVKEIRYQDQRRSTVGWATRLRQLHPHRKLRE